MKKYLLSTAALCAVALSATSAQAANFQAGDWDLSWVTQLTAGAGLRTEDASCSMIGNAAAMGCKSANPGVWSNNDNGNLNYKHAGSVYTSYIKATSELLATNSDGWKFFVRGSGVYDAASLWPEQTDFNRASYDQINKAVLYDLWLNKEFEIGDQRGHIRFGNQVINWGESIWAIGGINATNSFDYGKLLIPGTQIKEGLLPAPMLSIASGLGHGFSVEAYYQVAWNHSQFPAVGTFFSTGDIFDRGRQPLFIDTSNFNLNGLDASALSGLRSVAGINAATALALSGGYAQSIAIPFRADKKPPSQGQGGINLHFKPPGTLIDLGFYAMNYHDKTPVLTSYADGTAGWGFLKDRQVYGTSINFPWGDWAFGGEYSYRPHDAVALSSCFGAGGPTDANTNGVAGIDCPQYKDYQKHQVDLTALLNLIPSNSAVVRFLGADAAVLTSELTLIYYPGVSGNRPVVRNIGGQLVEQVPVAAYDTWLQTGSGGYPIVAGKGTATSGGSTIDFNWTYDGSLIRGWQVTPGTTWGWSIFGYTPTFMANYLKNAQYLNFYTLFNQNPAVWQAGVNFTHYFGGSTLAQPYHDRDFVGVFVTRNF